MHVDIEGAARKRIDLTVMLMTDVLVGFEEHVDLVGRHCIFASDDL